MPHVDFFEGVGPIEPFRVAKNGADPFQTFPAEYDWGPDMTNLLEISHRYQIPLWRLVLHDCVVAYLRWDEANNKFANPLWKTKRRCSALNGRPPMFMFDPPWWNDPANQQTLAEIYRQTGPLAQKVGTARMIDHCRLDAAGDVQRTRFDNGVWVTVNFVRAPPASCPTGRRSAPFRCRCTKIPAIGRPHPTDFQARFLSFFLGEDVMPDRHGPICERLLPRATAWLFTAGIVAALAWAWPAAAATKPDAEVPAIAGNAIYVLDLTSARAGQSARSRVARQAWDILHLTASVEGIVNRHEPRLFVRFMPHPDDFWFDYLRHDRAG